MKTVIECYEQIMIVGETLSDGEKAYGVDYRGLYIPCCDEKTAVEIFCFLVNLTKTNRIF